MSTVDELQLTRYCLNGPSHVHPLFIHFAVMFANSRLIALSGNV